MKQEQKLLDEFVQRAEDMGVPPLEIDRFFYEGFYEELGEVDTNIDTLKLFLRNGRL